MPLNASPRVFKREPLHLVARLVNLTQNAIVMVAVRRAPSCAPVSKFSGLLTCVRLPSHSFSSDQGQLHKFGEPHEKDHPRSTRVIPCCC